MKRNRTMMLLLTALVGVGAVSAAICFSGRPQTPEAVLEVNGIVRGTEITIGSRISGRIEQLPIDEGMRVEKDDLVAQISSDEIEAALQQAQGSVQDAFHRLHLARENIKKTAADIRQAQTQLEQSQRNFDRFAALLSEKAVSRSRYEQVQTALKIAEARLDAAKNAHEAARAAFQSAE